MLLYSTTTTTITTIITTTAITTATSGVPFFFTTSRLPLCYSKCPSIITSAHSWKLALLWNSQKLSLEIKFTNTVWTFLIQIYCLQNLLRLWLGHWISKPSSLPALLLLIHVNAFFISCLPKIFQCLLFLRLGSLFYLSLLSYIQFSV